MKQNGRGRGQGNPNFTGARPLKTEQAKNINRELEILRRKRDALQREQQMLSMECDIDRKGQYEYSNYNMFNSYGDNWQPPPPQRFNAPQYMGPSTSTIHDSPGASTSYSDGPSLFSNQFDPPMMSMELKPLKVENDYHITQVTMKNLKNPYYKLNSYSARGHKKGKGYKFAKHRTKKNEDPATMILREGQIPSQQLNGRLESALGCIVKQILSNNSHNDVYKTFISYPMNQRTMKQVVRDRIRNIMLNKAVGTTDDIVFQYRKKFSKASDKDIIEVVKNNLEKNETVVETGRQSPGRQMSPPRQMSPKRQSPGRRSASPRPGSPLKDAQHEVQGYCKEEEAIEKKCTDTNKSEEYNLEGEKLEDSIPDFEQDNKIDIPEHPVLQLKDDPEHPSAVLQLKDVPEHPPSELQLKNVPEHPSSVLQPKDVPEHPPSVSQLKDVPEHPPSVLQLKDVPEHRPSVSQLKDVPEHPPSVSQVNEPELEMENKDTAEIVTNAEDRPEFNEVWERLTGAARKRYKLLIAAKVPSKKALKMCQKGWKQLPAYAHPKKRIRNEQLALWESNAQLHNSDSHDKSYFFKEKKYAEVQIQDDDHMTKEQSDMLRQALIWKIMHLPKSQGPRFLSYGYMSGALMVSCVDKQSQKWLYDNVPLMEPWPGAKLTATYVPGGFKPLVFNALLPESETSDASQAFSLIKRQNPGLNTEDWALLSSKRLREGLHITVSVDYRSAIILQKKNFQICLGFKMVRLIRCDTSGKQRLNKVGKKSSLYKLTNKKKYNNK